MDENPLLNCSTMQVLVLDEADGCLGMSMGFKTTMNAITENLGQTPLFGHTNEICKRIGTFESDKFRVRGTV